jgi:hypothetical protein
MPGWETIRTTPGSPAPYSAHSVNTGCFAPEGSVWECECARTFVAFYDRRHGCLAAFWRPERRRERKRRLKAAAS